jgi:hypothetical protein
VIVNTGGLTVLGTGSEWFWSMLQFVVVAITLAAIYRQVRLQASAAAVQQMDAVAQKWQSEVLTRHTLNLHLAMRDGADPEHIPFGAASTLGDFWESVAYLTRHGHLDVDLVHENLGGAIQSTWAAIATWVGRIRRESEDPRTLGDFEWLAGECALRDRRAGVTRVYDWERVMGSLDRSIENDQERLEVAEALRSAPATPRGRTRSK